MIEIVNPAAPRGRIRHALFDFDGTLSLIREGWQKVMEPMMVELLLQTPRHESAAELAAVVREFVTRLTGKQTIYQMLQLVAEIAQRGGQPQDALVYKRIYLQRLWERIKDRRAALDEGRVQPDDLMVPGARAVLDNLRARGIKCYLASGTDDADVHAEAEALRVSGYFVRINGALEDYKRSSKKLVVAQIIAENGLQGRELVVFGDGFVEIEEVKQAGGLAVGVATDETTRNGRDEWKRARLIQAGADLIVADFREQEELVAYLAGEDRTSTTRAAE